jgi:hypothetical protein
VAVFFVSSYVKLQEAYFSETNHVGNWAIIGYTAPRNPKTSGVGGLTTNFDYSQQGDYEDNTIATDPTSALVWQVQARVKLNDCGTEDTWGVQATVSSAKVSFATGLSDEANCLMLTPNFKNIGTGTYTAASGD